MVVADATFCKQCGASLHPLRGEWGRLMVAAALSIIPGLGHLYRGYPWRALAWFIGVGLAYMAPPLGLLLHLICAASAALAGVGGHGVPSAEANRARDFAARPGA